MSALIQFFLTYSLSIWLSGFWRSRPSSSSFTASNIFSGARCSRSTSSAAIQAVMKWLPFYYELFCPSRSSRAASPAPMWRARHPMRLDARHVGRGQPDVETRARALSGRWRLRDLPRVRPPYNGQGGAPALTNLTPELARLFAMPARSFQVRQLEKLVPWRALGRLVDSSAR